MSSRRNASVVVALGVASLAATSLAAMLATSDLLVESFAPPVSGQLPPPIPDLGGPGVIQVEPPEPKRAKPPGRPRPPAAEPPPGPRPAEPAAAAGRAGRAGTVVVVAVRRRPARQAPAVVRAPVADLPATPSGPRWVRPRPAPHRPERTRPPRARRRWANHKPRPDGRVRVPPAPRPARPRPADPDHRPAAGSPCPDRPRHDEQRWPGRDRPTRDDGERRWKEDGHRSGGDRWHRRDGDLGGSGEDRWRSRDGDRHGPDKARRAQWRERRNQSEGDAPRPRRWERGSGGSAVDGRWQWEPEGRSDPGRHRDGHEGSR